MMRRSIASIGALVLSTGIALGADLPRPAYAPVPVIYNWTGFYIGGNLGGGWAHSKSEFSVSGGPVFGTADNYLSGVVGGGQVGYNWQAGPIVYGVEADFQASGLTGSLTAPQCPAAACGAALSASYTQEMPWFGTVRGRVGYAADTWLIYATGGYAYARLNTDAVAAAGPASTSLNWNDIRDGWTIGGGIEVAFAARWSAKLEYLYLDYGRHDTALQLTGLPVITDSSRLNQNLVRAGVNYRF
jgi:outer membrane immunogenic protein